ncbi:MAG: DNA polymerase I [Lachnospiraceae bacterium]|nr:DNA polymerase I [Lachnospiraceae bacterium]
MSEKIVLIDGHSIMNRAYYGIPLLTSSAGLHTNAVYGFLNIMFKVLEEEKAQYLAVAFDLSAPTFRHKEYSAYKGTRHAMPDELREQIPVIKEMLGAMGVPLMMLEGYEADDLIGTASKRAEENGLDVRVISGDRDLLQLASDRTQIRIPKTKKGGTEVENYFASDVLEKYQVTPEEFIHVKALMGDASDNIPGIPGVGEKTAVKIISEYHSIENAHEHIDEIRPARAQNSLRDYWEDARLSLWLATIDRDAPFELDLEAARLDPEHAALYTPKALELCKKLELRTMITRMLDGMNGIISAAGTEGADKPGEAEAVFEMVDDTGAFLDAAAESGRVGIQIAYIDDRMTGYAVAFDCRCGYIPGDDAGALKSVIGRADLVCAIDLKEQLAFLDGGLDERKFFDCAVGAYLLNPLQGEYSYDYLSGAYAGAMVPSRTELFGKKKDKDLTQDDWMKITCFKARSALESSKRIRSLLDEQGMGKLFDDIEMPLVFVLYRMQREGILVKAQELHDYGVRLSERIAGLERQIYEEAGKEFNINSPKQLGTVLFEDLHLPSGKKTKTGYSTAADVLEKLAEDNSIVADILEYRQLTKLKSTYAEGLSEYIAQDGRIHGKFNQTITATGRISSTDPNLQNIPVRTELGRELRKVFVPKDGSRFVDADYSQIELRILAHMSQDQALIEAYNSAEDIHAITASSVFHVPLEEVTPQLRRNAKAVNFGIVYGISSFGLSQGLSITRREAARFIEQYFHTFPGIKAFLDEEVRGAKERGWCSTMFGRRRPVPELKESNFMRRSFGERVAMNAPIQGTAADIIKIAMIGVDRRLREEGLKSRLVLQIHDELLVEAARDEVDEVKRILREEMEGAADMKVRLEIDMHDGASWYEAH